MKRLATLSLAILMLFVSSYTSHAYSEIDSWFEAEFEDKDMFRHLIVEPGDSKW